jgi:hypothetical protein
MDQSPGGYVKELVPDAMLGVWLENIASVRDPVMIVLALMWLCHALQKAKMG